MNKAFVREPDTTETFCPKCGAAGVPVPWVTVEHHVSRILVKLGVTSRREEARTAHQLDLAIPRDASEPRDHRAG